MAIITINQGNRQAAEDLLRRNGIKIKSVEDFRKGFESGGLLFALLGGKSILDDFDEGSLSVRLKVNDEKRAQAILKQASIYFI